MTTTTCPRGEAGSGGSCSRAEQCTAAYGQPPSTCACCSHPLVAAARCYVGSLQQAATLPAYRCPSLPCKQAVAALTPSRQWQ